MRISHSVKKEAVESGGAGKVGWVRSDVPRGYGAFVLGGLTREFSRAVSSVDHSADVKNLF